MTSLAIVGCGEAKLDASDINGAVELRNLYTSTYFRKKREYAEVVCDVWFVLSAKYGLVGPYKKVTEPYDRSLDDLSDHETGEWAIDVRTDLRNHVAGFGVEEVHLLVGQQYELAIEDVLEDELQNGYDDVVRPFAGTPGHGEQMAVLDELVDEARGPGQSTLEQAGDGR